MIKIKIVNQLIYNSIEENFRNICKIIDETEEATFIIFPEGSLSGYFPEIGFENIDYDLVNLSIAKIANISKLKKVALLFGSLIKAHNKIFNTSIFIDFNQNVFTYKKINLATLERGHIFSGDKQPIFKIKQNEIECNFGIQMCREIRFPEQWKHLALKSAQVIFHINNAIGSDDDYDIWKAHLISRAAELQRFVVSVNAADDKQKSPTIIINPAGKILEEIKSSDQITKTIKLNIQTVSNWYLEQSRFDVVN